MTTTAQSRHHDLEVMRREGNGKLANILETGQSQGYADWYKQWQIDNPDAPSSEHYNYQMIYDKGMMPEPSDDGSLAFLPAEGWIDRRSATWSPEKFSAEPTSYDINSKSWQSESGPMRAIRHGLGKAYQQILGEFTAPITNAAAAMGGYEGDPEKARADLMQAMTPDAIELAQINESETWGGAAEQMGSLLIELAAYIGIGKGALNKEKTAKVVKDAFSRGKMKDGLTNLVNRLEEAVDPGVVMGEYLYASSDPETMSGALGDTLEEWGYSGGLVEFLRGTDDDPYRRTVTNIVEGMIFFEALRTAARLGKHIPEKTLKSAMEFVTTKYDEAVKELDVLQRALPTGMAGVPSTAKATGDAQKAATVEYKQAKESDSLPDHPPYTPPGEQIVIPESEIVLPGPASSRKGAADPRINNRLVSAVNLPKPLHEIEQGIKRVSKGEAVPEVIITPETLKGQNIMYVYGDKTLGDATIVDVDGKPLRNPVDAEGGRIFMRTGTKDGYVWASGQSIISRIMNSARSAADANGEPVNVIYVAMGPAGMDFSHMPIDVHLQRLADAKMSSKTVKAYDTIMADKIKGWKGIRHKDTPDFLNENSDRRKTFLKWSDQATISNLEGVPDVGTSRLAVTDPKLLRTPLSEGGFGISRINLDGSPRLTGHQTYNTDLPGQYIGDLSGSVPFEILFPQIAEFFRATGKGRYDYRAQFRSLSEVADDAWVNRVSEYLEKKK